RAVVISMEFSPIKRGKVATQPSHPAVATPLPTLYRPRTDGHIGCVVAGQPMQEFFGLPGHFYGWLCQQGNENRKCVFILGGQRTLGSPKPNHRILIFQVLPCDRLLPLISEAADDARSDSSSRGHGILECRDKHWVQATTG